MLKIGIQGGKQGLREFIGPRGLYSFSFNGHKHARRHDIMPWL